MPWKVVKRGKDWCVVKAEDGKVIPGGNHNGDKPEAVAHLRAVYANAKD